MGKRVNVCFQKYYGEEEEQKKSLEGVQELIEKNGKQREEVFVSIISNVLENPIKEIETHLINYLK